mgnify:CR=1 FL=1
MPRYPSLSTRKRAKQIAERLAEGESTRSIARAFEMSERRVRQIMDRYSVPMNRPNTVRFSFHASRRRAEIIQRVAEAAEVSPSTMIDRIVSTIVDDGVEAAKKRLGTLAQPGHSKVAKP